MLRPLTNEEIQTEKLRISTQITSKQNGTLLLDPSNPRSVAYGMTDRELHAYANSLLREMKSAGYKHGTARTIVKVGLFV